MTETTDLANERCDASGSEAVLTVSEAMKLLKNLHEGWSVNSMGRLERVFLTKEFLDSLELAVQIGKVAEVAHYFPDLMIQNGLFRVEIWSRSLNGLSRADFILAAKIDVALVKEGKLHV